MTMMTSHLFRRLLVLALRSPPLAEHDVPLLQWLDSTLQLPESFVLFASQPTSMSLISLRSLSNVLAVLSHDFWSTPEKATAVLSTHLPRITPVLDNRDISNVPYVRAVVSLIASFSVSEVRRMPASRVGSERVAFQYKHTIRSWRSVWSQLLHQDFFKTDAESLEQWRFVVARIVAEDQSALNELMGRVTGGQSLIFSNHKADVLQRARQLKRLSFLIHSG
jgi:hypothetical protein